MIIVAGASGYLGRKIHSKALKFGVVRGTSRTDSTLLPLRLEAADSFDYTTINKADIVLMTASISSPDVCDREYKHAWAVNVEGTTIFISHVLSRGARVAFFSSDMVYGEQVDGFDESTPGDPAGNYAIMKLEIERRFYGNPNFKAIRLSYTFSREDSFTRYLCTCAEHSQYARIFDPLYRSVVYRDDVVDGVISLARRWEEFPQSVINFGGPDTISRTVFAETLKDRALPDLRIVQVEPPPGFFLTRPREIRMNSPILTSLLGRRPRSLRDAVDIEFDSNQNHNNEGYHA